jgi:hypothetical protein
MPYVVIPADPFLIIRLFGGAPATWLAFVYQIASVLTQSMLSVMLADVVLLHLVPERPLLSSSTRKYRVCAS